MPEPAPSAATWQQASALVELRRYEQAAALLGPLIASNPAAGRPRCLLAQCHLGLDDPRRALEAAEGAVAAQPDLPWAHRLRSLALRRLQRRRPALDAALEAVRLDPSDYRNHLTLADAEVANHHWKQAEAAADRAVALAPEASEGYNAQGLVALYLNHLDEAAAKFRLALARNPQNAQALNNLGVTLLRHGQRNQAIHYFAEASRIDPRFTLPRRNAVRAAKAWSAPVAVLILLLAIESLPSSVGALVALALLVALGILLARRVRRVGWRVAMANRGTLFILRSRARRQSDGDPQASKELLRQLRREKAPPRARKPRRG